MNWIELMGPSGIGKTTLKRQLVKSRKKEEDWVLPSEAFLEIARVSKQRQLSKRITKSLLFPRVAKAGNGMLFRYLLKYDEAFLKEASKYQSLVDLKIKHHFFREQDDSIEKAYRISLFKSIITEMCVLDYYNYKKTVLLEAGPYNHSKELHRYPAFEKENPSILPQAFIFCNLDLDTNLERLEKRNSKGRTVPLHRGLSDLELRKLVSEKQREYLEKVSFLKTLHVPFLELDLNNDPSNNIRDIKIFLEQLN